jgi:ubiquinone/menaquinone biosynthesis C-methylase UbiE
LMLSQNTSDGEKTLQVAERVYCNAGNPPLIDLLGKGCNSVLDIGCGAGDNAVLVKSAYSECNVYGITHSNAEAALTQNRMVRCWVFDIEHEFPADLEDQLFDCLIFSHVLEHLRDPAAVLARFSRLLRKGGQVLIIVVPVFKTAV